MEQVVKRPMRLTPLELKILLEIIKVTRELTLEDLDKNGFSISIENNSSKNRKLITSILTKTTNMRGKEAKKVRGITVGYNKGLLVRIY